MKKSIQKTSAKELKREIKKTFDNKLADVVKGRVSIQDFMNQINYNYTQKKIELSGTLF